MLGLGSGINRLSAAEAVAIAGRLPGFTGLLDESYGTSAEAAYSVRRLTNRVSAAITIRRDSDSTETDIGFDANGNIDEAAITAFCTGTTCRVASWKDQSGNDNHAVQAVAARQPTIYTGGALVKENGKLALDFGGTSELNFTTIAKVDVDPFAVFTVAQDTPNNLLFVDSTDVQNDALLVFTTYGQMRSRWNGSTYLDAINSDSLYRLFSVIDDGTNPVDVFYSGTSVQIPGYDVTNKAINLNRIGGTGYQAGARYSGIMQEAIFYFSDKSSVQTDIESNIGDYFTQNTPLLDTYTGAAAAYSLRKLSSSYSGPAIRVRRDNDNLETDINFNVFGELDTVSLAAHCGSNNGYVANWYDQSSNSNTARQTTAASQPKIYDSTTGVVTENGKPSLQFDGSKTISIGSYSSLTEGELFTTVRWLGDTTTRGGFKISTQGNDMHFPYYGGTVYDNFGSTTRYAFNPSITLNQLNLYNSLSKSGEWTARLNANVEKTSATNTVGFSSGSIGSYTMNHNFSEFIIYNAVQSSANRAGIETNINTFYSIY